MLQRHFFYRSMIASLLILLSSSKKEFQVTSFETNRDASSSSSSSFLMSFVFRNHNVKQQQQQQQQWKRKNNHEYVQTKRIGYIPSCQTQSLSILSAAPSEGKNEYEDMDRLDDLNIPSPLPPPLSSSSSSEINESSSSNSNSNGNDKNNIMKKTKWNVYVCQSNKERSEMPIPPIADAFLKLSATASSSSSDDDDGSDDNAIISVYPAKFKGGKGPNVRCIQVKDNGKEEEEEEENARALEINNVDSVEKVYRILTKYMGIEGIDPLARDCLKHNYKGNSHLEKGEISDAILSYDKAIATNYTPYEGIILLMRSTAYLRRAFNHQSALRDVVSDLATTVPESDAVIPTLYRIGWKNPTLAGAICKRVIQDCRVQDKKFQQTKYRHGLYEYALLHAAQDSLRATELLPDYAKAWLRAGDSLAELRKLKESVQYYERAVEVDPTLTDTLAPIIERLQESQEFLNKARANGWSEDTLRLALDVAG